MGKDKSSVRAAEEIGQRSMSYHDETDKAGSKLHTKRAVFVTPQIFSTDYGGGIRVIEETRALSLHGAHAVSVYTYGFGKASVSWLPSSVSLNKIWFTPRIFSAGPTLRRLPMDVQLALKSITSLRCNPDVVHVHAHEGVPLAKVLRHLNGCPLVFDIQGSTADEMVRGGWVKNRGFTYQLLWRFEQLLNNMATVLISSSPIMSGILTSHLGMAKEKIVTVLDAVDTDLFKPLGKQAKPVRRLRKRLSIPETDRVVIYVGSFSKLQGTDILIRSVPHVLRSNANVTFLLVGGKWNPEYLQSMKGLAEKLNIGKHIVFVSSADYFEELPCYLSLADVAVAPKMPSPQSHGKLALYMAFGLPSVIFDIPINRVFLGELGIFVDTISPEGLAEGIVLALDEYAENAEFALKLRARATALFSLERLAADLENAYCLASFAG